MRLTTVTLLVPDYADGIAFFTAIGWTVTEDRPEGGAKRWITVAPPGGGAAILLARAVGAQVTGIGRQSGGRVGFFLETDDFPRDAARITAAGGTFEEPPRKEAYGTVAVFRDPWGNRWDLIGR